MRSVLLAIASVLICHSIAHATPQCEPITEASERMVPTGNTTDFLTGLNVSLILALKPSTFPYEQISQNNQPCMRSEFDSAEIHYSMYGSDADSPPRWAISEAGNRVAYIAIAPSPRLALDWYNKTGGKGNLEFDEPPIYIVAVTDGDARDIYAFFNSLPSDEQLLNLFQAALAGTTKRLLRFELQSNKMELTSAPNDW